MIVIQQNMRESKEEEFQEGFIRELPVNIFDYNIVLEKKLLWKARYNLLKLMLVMNWVKIGATGSLNNTNDY